MKKGHLIGRFLAAVVTFAAFAIAAHAAALSPMYYLNHARTVTGVDKLRTDAPMTFRNGGMPVTGNGDFSVLVIDSGIDATTADLPVQKLSRTRSVSSRPTPATPASRSAALPRAGYIRLL